GLRQAFTAKLLDRVLNFDRRVAMEANAAPAIVLFVTQTKIKME
ncbi:hypothetical protein EDC30_1275, partial [Paucimonas lemoignei]